MSREEVALVVRKSKVKMNPIVTKAIEYVSKNNNLTWIDFLRFNVISSTNETVQSVDNMYFTDLLALNEFLKMKDFIDNVSHNVQNDEIERVNKRK